MRCPKLQSFDRLVFVFDTLSCINLDLHTKKMTIIDYNLEKCEVRTLERVLNIRKFMS